jgi:hypothetical protein
MEGGVGGDKFSILIEQSAALSQERVEVFNRLEASAFVGDPSPRHRSGAVCRKPWAAWRQWL